MAFWVSVLFPTAIFPINFHTGNFEVPVVAFLIADVDVAWPAIVEVLLVDYYFMDRVLPVFRLVNSDVLANLIIVVGGSFIIIVGLARSNHQA